MGKLEGKVALVTGGGTGIGRATALAFAGEGIDVAVNYSRSKADAEATAAEIEGMGRAALAVCADVSDDAAVRRMVERVASELGRLDILVNNAGWTRYVPLEDLEGLSGEAWDRCFDVNVNGTFYLLPGRGAEDEGERGGTDRERRLDRRSDRSRQLDGLRRLQGGGDLPHEGVCDYTGAGDPRERRLARRRGHAVDGRDGVVHGGQRAGHAAEESGPAGGRGGRGDGRGPQRHDDRAEPGRGWRADAVGARAVSSAACLQQAGRSGPNPPSCASCPSMFSFFEQGYIARLLRPGTRAHFRRESRIKPSIKQNLPSCFLDLNNRFAD